MTAPSGEELDVGDDGRDDSGVIKLASEPLRWKGVRSESIGCLKTVLAGRKNESVANIPRLQVRTDAIGEGK